MYKIKTITYPYGTVLEVDDTSCEHDFFNPQTLKSQKDIDNFINLVENEISSKQELLVELRKIRGEIL